MSRVAARAAGKRRPSFALRLLRRASCRASPSAAAVHAGMAFHVGGRSVRMHLSPHGTTLGGHRPGRCPQAPPTISPCGADIRTADWVRGARQGRLSDHISHAMKQFVPRWLQGRVERALKALPVVMVARARQTGKSTLVRHIHNRFADAHGSATARVRCVVLYGGRDIRPLGDRVMALPFAALFPRIRRAG